MSGLLLILLRAIILNLLFRHEKLGKLIYQCERVFTNSIKLSIKLNSWLILLGMLMICVVPGLAIFYTPRPPSTHGLWTLGFLFVVVIWNNCQRTEIRSKGLWYQGRVILWKNIINYGWSATQDIVLVKLEKSGNFFSGHKGGDFSISIFEGDREEVAKYFNIYLEGKERPLSPSK
jgi:hypothetical protein